MKVQQEIRALIGKVEYSNETYQNRKLKAAAQNSCKTSNLLAKKRVVLKIYMDIILGERDFRSLVLR